MGFFDKLLKRDKGNYALALDIGTAVVKALIFRVDQEEMTGEVVGVGRRKQKLGDMHGGAVTDIQGVVDSCDRAIAEASDQAKISPDQAIIGIAGELVKGSTTTVHYERLKPNSRINLPELKNIIQKVQWKAFDQVRKQLAWETGHPEIDVKLINAAIVDVRIDGYRVTNPIGFQGKDVSIGIFNAYAPLVHLGALQTIASELDLDLLNIAAEPYAVARSVGIEDDSELSAIFIDIGGGTTDIAVVRNGGIEGTKMFALGGRAFTKRVASKLALSFDEAEDLKVKYSQGKLEINEASKVKEALDNDCKVWLSGVELALSEFSNIDLLPSTIMLCGGGSALPGIRAALQTEDWVKELPFTRQPQVQFIQPKDVTNIKDTTDRLQNSQDITPMGLANLALDLTGEEKIASSILRKVVRMMQS